MEKKMKKINKVIMMMVAILLTLVLISTSVVSGIFAKYVISKEATTIVSLKKFGVKLAIEKGTNYDASGATVTTGAISESSLNATVTVALVPGDDFKEIIKFVPTIDSTVGKASVATNIKVKAEVTSTIGDANKQSSKYYVPSGFYINNTMVSDAFISNSNATTIKSTLQTNINNGLKVNGLGLASSATADSDGYFSTSLADKNGTSVKVAKIGIGAFCPITSNNATDTVMTALATAGATVTIKYTVSLEQAS